MGVDRSATTSNRGRRHGEELAGVGHREFRLALSRLPGLVRDATRLFNELTRFTAVAGFGSLVVPGDGGPGITPPVHPLCIERLRAAPREAPCEQQWQAHLERSLRSRAVQSHVCPLGLRCACIPIYYRERLAGVAKCVTHRGTDRRRFSAAVRILELALEKASQDLCVSVQLTELEALRQRMGRLREIKLGGPGAPKDTRASATPKPAGSVESGSLIERALDYISAHYLERDGALKTISRKLGVTDKYLTCRFTAVVGQRMHAYILQLRIQHACRALLVDDTPIKQVAYDSGFNRVETFRRSFRRYVGVSAAAYRSAFLRG
jgi:AraC-like DNA-binding protein